MSTIQILSGPVHSGKTTRLMNWAISKKNTDGIFQPVIDEKRFVFHIKSRTLKLLETDEKENTTPIGKYKFSNSTLDWSRNILNQCISEEPDWIIIDEIGPLELGGKGLEPSISKILTESSNLSSNIICVVREEMLERFIEHYDLKEKYQKFE